MIEKIPFETEKITHNGKTMEIDTHASPYDLQIKINELVDAVNNIVSVQEKLIDSRFVVETKHEEPADPYAEQRKWIGKVCWFWDDDNTNSSCGILTSIDTETFKEPQFVCNDEYNYEHCEPVKPDSELIYHGE